MNCTGFFRNAVVNTIIGIAIILAIFAAGIALAAHETNKIRNIRLEMAASTPVQVEYFKVPRVEIDLGEQYIYAE